MPYNVPSIKSNDVSFFFQHHPQNTSFPDFLFVWIDYSIYMILPSEAAAQNPELFK